MKKIILILASLSVLLLSGCQSTTTSEKQNASTHNSGLTTKDNQLTLSEFLKTGTSKNPLLLYSVDTSEGIGKDSEISDIYIFSEGKVTSYHAYSLIDNLGELAKMSDKEIIEVIETRFDEKTREELDSAIHYIEDSLSSSGETTIREDNESDEEKQQREENKKYFLSFNETLLSSLNDLKNSKKISNDSFPYLLSIHTDNSGNNTEMEKISFQFQNTKIKIYEDFWSSFETTEDVQDALENKSYEPRKIEDDSIKFDAPYLDYAQSVSVYDSIYKVFKESDGDLGFFTRIEDENIQLTADEPGEDKDIAVDPND